LKERKRKDEGGKSQSVGLWRAERERRRSAAEVFSAVSHKEAELSATVPPALHTTGA
jgi:hypothetical protein